jgi:hypothetical protein
MASKMFNTYCKMVGLEYLWQTLGLIMYELAAISKTEEDDKAIMLKTSMEVDPNRMEENEDVFTNQLQLKLFAHKLWKAIIASEKKVPRFASKDAISDGIYRDFLELFHVVATEIPNKFSDPTATYKGVGGFFFLRLICPAITNPHVYGLLQQSPNEVMQRSLVLLSKILQNISNGKFKEQLNKETRLYWKFHINTVAADQ